MTTGDDATAKLEARRRELEALTAEIAALEAAAGGRKKPPPVSPLAPAGFPDLPAIAGVRLAAGAAGVRYKGRLDVMLAELAPGSVMAGTFTRSATRSAPVLWCEERIAALAGGAEGPLGIVVNSGNSNAFTGRNGREAVERVMQAAGAALGTAAGNCFMASTGVIGEPLPHERITAKLAEMAAALASDAMEPAARAIMTTDTFPKGATARVDLDGAQVTIAGFAKGSGMIAPDMGTMLVFIFTDCAIAQPVLQEAVRALTDRTFNAITVDSDTSTSDTLLVGATGRAGMAPIRDAADRRLPAFIAALEGVMRDLAIQVVKDGEGATKLVRITISGAASPAAARRIGLSVANSPLVKTAVAGEDPNWGRIVMAVGKAGEAADRDRLSIRFGDIVVAEQGWVSPGYREADGAAYMKRQEIDIHVDVGVGEAEATVWTCDLTKRYIEINADYRS
ncbi:bifunctional glutamate N-acetyltransferase/amino-acid acetyltransferase ArgJ [Limibaculum sp. FT325]|uniref:bifunctional glutamate N-acetyltransferase/amino-acid acetyltransferase ArgJ n=1 Tax=Thermohalobaculum sediminis TaxID=2939436 RepID=UPI0020BFD090|nr:bifunctional glutamate N-acetyltransferase/amino-acid acetyltransferase ArgJ [Limibaculum sediminis]MCL5778013.1 bifunctional glutamate N-acetyltransferase/amino-acid acetyltransferase ArgJ [Limibaculum sediminis]